MHVFSFASWSFHREQADVAEESHHLPGISKGILAVSQSHPKNTCNQREGDTKNKKKNLPY